METNLNSKRAGLVAVALFALAGSFHLPPDLFTM